MALDLDAIHAKGYTDNVVDLMVSKLNRLPATTQTALQQLACIGNSAESAVFLPFSRRPDKELKQRYGRPAARTDRPLGELLPFAHDRVQEATYSLHRAVRRAPRFICE